MTIDQSISKTAPLLQVEDLRVRFRTPRGWVNAVNGVTFDLDRGETMAVVGESGSGKSAMAQAVMRLLSEPPAQVHGRVSLDGREISGISERQFREIRGRHISMVFQNATNSLNPVRTIGNQLEEVMRLHLHLSRPAAQRRAVEFLDMVGIPEPRRQLSAYPFQFSGGMQQRVMIASALACEPRIVIADEPTTAVDVTIQAQILDLLGRLTRELGTALLLISHDMAAVAGIARRIAVMYAGRIVETGETAAVYSEPRHPYTLGLLHCIPDLSKPRTESLVSIEGSPPDPMMPVEGCSFAPRCRFVMPRCHTTRPPLEEKAPGRWAACWAELAGREHEPGVDPVRLRARRSPEPVQDPVLAVRDLRVWFPGPRESLVGRRTVVRAVDGISLEVGRGETLGVVGESGSGKSSTGRAIVSVERHARGEVMFQGQSLLTLRRRAMRGLRPQLQMVFQDPFGSINDRHTVGSAIAEPLVIARRHSRQEIRARVSEALQNVGLDPGYAGRYPNELSGGQLQRVGIARALIQNPTIIVADEPTAALDVSIRAQILNLMRSLQRARNLAYVFISHDLSIVRHMSDRIAVMYGGKVMELADAEELFANPQHPYTRLLLDAVPRADPSAERRIRDAAEARRRTSGQMAVGVGGCRFRDRCPLAFDRCSEEEPPLMGIDPEHWSACFLSEVHAEKVPAR